jgi:hypothetical protein
MFLAQRTIKSSLVQVLIIGYGNLVWHRLDLPFRQLIKFRTGTEIRAPSWVSSALNVIVYDAASKGAGYSPL